MLKILFLEDDPIITDIVLEYLRTKKYSVDYAFDVEEAYQLAFTNKYDIFLFDVNVPNGNGFTLLKELRESKINTPTIFITALNSMDDMKIGFKSGCDDYIKKPFELDELELRLENIKRLYKLQDFIQIDKNIFLDKTKLHIIINNTKIAISNKELQVLEYISKNHTRLITHEELANNIWSFEESPSDATIRTYIKNLRFIIGAEKIITIRGAGYRFIKE